MGKLKPETRDKLRGVSTATICTALFKREEGAGRADDPRPLPGDGGENPRRFRRLAKGEEEVRRSVRPSTGSG